MNAHALAALTTGDDEEEQAHLDEWIAHTAAVTLAWEALDAAIREEVDR